VRSLSSIIFSRALESAWGLVAAVDKYIVENEPWALGEKDDEGEPGATGDGALHLGGGVADCDGSGASRDARSDGEDLDTAGARRHQDCSHGGIEVGTDPPRDQAGERGSGVSPRG
jgi:hypothetical protein